jgi:fatty-acid desaturase
MFAITGIYHFQDLALRAISLCNSWRLRRRSAGPLWWAADHRNHQRHSDTIADPIRPYSTGFLRSHAGWFMCTRYYDTRYSRIQDFARFPVIMLVDAVLDFFSTAP